MIFYKFIAKLTGWLVDKNKNATISGIKNRDLKVFEELFFTYHGRLVLFANKFLGDMQASQDMVQDVFVNLWDKADQFEIKESPKSYLFQAVKNVCLNHARHITIKQNAAIEFENKLRAQEQQIEANTSSPYFSLIELELEDKINEVIESMPDKCREVFKMSRFESLKNKEIAEKLDISVKMVEKHISKALSILRTDLAEYIGLLLTLLFLDK